MTLQRRSSRGDIAFSICRGERCGQLLPLSYSATSILRFIEYNWGLGTIRDPQSFDVLASGKLLGMFDFDRYHGEDGAAERRKLILAPITGEVAGAELDPWN